PTLPHPLSLHDALPISLGRIGILNTDGPVATRGHPFFEPLGTNGRACVSCHQPGDAMSLAVETIRQRWEDTNGTDPIFAAIDGRSEEHTSELQSRENLV